MFRLFSDDGYLSENGEKPKQLSDGNPQPSDKQSASSLIPEDLIPPKKRKIETFTPSRKIKLPNENFCISRRYKF